MKRFHHQCTFSAFPISSIRFCSSISRKHISGESEFPNSYYGRHKNHEITISVGELYEQAERDLQIPIAKLLLTMKNKQRTLSRIRENERQSSSSPISLVTSAVLATPSSCSCGDVCTCPPILKFTGVNSAFHKQIHHSASSSSSSSSTANESNNNNSNFVIKGLLKGCAEQNALGSFAASGNNFEQVRGIVICSLVLSSKNRRDNNNKHQENEVEASSSSCCCCFPCTACRNYLYKVRTDFVSKRHKNQILKLSCISLKLEDMDAVVNNSKNNSLGTTKQVVSLECMEGWNTSFREEIIRI